MDKFRTWYLEYQNEITWFVVGLLFANMLEHLAKGQLWWALWDVVLGAINVYLWKNNRV